MQNIIKRFNLPFIRYLFVGVSTTILDICLFWVLINFFHLYYLFAQVINSPIVLLYNYFGHKRITFNHPNHRPVNYILLITFNYFVGLGLLYFYVEIVKLSPILGKVCTIATFMFYNYFALKLLVFKHEDNS